ncbi:hypothetical protein P7K49_034923 [Saguinus oedipus]|uniref:Peptidase S1 domain-containing protein n=1 Tax=Saguinus oedipus TaxID=9490 RepID=A0ABQ9TWN2_SAGOE|nr:hypothetical protein P7K49_034923 [Saguinus oedipus]
MGEQEERLLRPIGTSFPGNAPQGAVRGYNSGPCPTPRSRQQPGRRGPEKSSAEPGTNPPPPTWGTGQSCTVSCICGGNACLSAELHACLAVTAVVCLVLRLVHPLAGTPSGVRGPPRARDPPRARAPPNPFSTPERVLTNDDVSCGNPSNTAPSGSNRDLGAGAGEDAQSDDSSSRILNGSDCEKHSQQWQAALLLGPNQLYCGAVLVHPQWLLTAAHCRKK